MAEIKFSKKKMVASLLTVCFVAHQSLMLNAVASNITGVVGDNGVYNIDPTAINGNIGYRQYKDFTLTEGDIANLIFKYGVKNVEKFVNLVDNRININGIVNSMRDGNFYDGHAIFVSPNGMVVGASGVLNVGALSVFSPTNADYLKYKDNYLYQSLDTVKQGNADVTINGKVIARDNIEVLAKTATIGANAGLMSGVNNSTALNSAEQANILFNSLVNTDATNANSFSSENGKIVIKTEDANGGILANGTIKNFGKGSINLTNNGSKGLKVAGNVQNAEGNTLVTNNSGALVVSGEVKNNGNITITNNGATGLIVSGDVKNNQGNVLLINKNGKMVVSGSTSNLAGNTNLKNESGELTISGVISNKVGALNVKNTGTKLILTEDSRVTNNGSTILYNSGLKGSDIAGTVSVSDANLLIQNDAGDLNLSGLTENSDGDIRVLSNGTFLNIEHTAQITNNKKSEILNNGNKGLLVAGSLINDAGDLIVQSNAGSMDIDGTIFNKNGNIVVSNYSGSLNLNELGQISGNGITKVYNEGFDGMSLNGDIANSGNLIVTNESGTLNINNSISNTDGKLAVTNNGVGLFVSSDSVVKSNGSLTMLNNGQDGLTIDGIVENTGNAIITNKVGDMNLNGKVINYNGKLNVTNRGKGLVIAGDIDSDDTLKVWNTGENGTLLSGVVSNKGNAIVQNDNGIFEVTGQIENENGQLDIVNTGSGMLMATSANVINNGTTNVLNTGLEGLEIQGVINNKGDANITNEAGRFDIRGEVTNVNGDLSLTNATGADLLTISGNIANNGGKLSVINNGSGVQIRSNSKIFSNDELEIFNTGNEGLLLSGTVENSGNTTIQNTQGKLTILGSLDNQNGKLKVVNSGTGFNVSSKGNIKNSDTLSIVNTGIDGIVINGVIDNAGDAIITNKTGDMNIIGSVINSSGKLNITNHGDALNVATSGKILSNDTLKIWNTGSEGTTVNGIIEHSGGNSVIQNDAADFTINGTINNAGGKLKLTNNGNALKISQNATVYSDGILNIKNTGVGGLDNAGTIVSTGHIKMTNEGVGGFNSTGSISNSSGNIKLVNKDGSMRLGGSVTADNSNAVMVLNESLNGDLTVDGSIASQSGDVEIFSAQGLNLQQAGNITGNIVTVTNSDADMVLNGNIDGRTKVSVGNYGSGKALLSGNINAQEGLIVNNEGLSGATISAKLINKNGTMSVTNTKGALDISGELQNASGKLLVSNSGDSLTLASTGLINNVGQLDINNTGINGMKVNGTVSNVGETNIQNLGAAGMEVAGLIDTVGNTLLENLNGTMLINGSVGDNNSGILTISNAGSDMNISGRITNTGKTRIINSGSNGMNISGVVDANGLTTVLNKSGELSVLGSIANQNGKLNITNNGTVLNIQETGKISNNVAMNILNNGDGGFLIDGTISNSGNTLLTNNAGDFAVNGSVVNSNGSLSLSNNGNAMRVSDSAEITNDSVLKMFNTGEGGLTIDGKVSNTNSTAVTNKAGDLLINGAVTNKYGNLNLTNSGNSLNITPSGKVSNEGKMVIQNIGVNGMNLDGAISSVGKTAITNTNGSLNIAGKLNTNGDFNLTNTGSGINISDTAKINHKGAIFAQNTGVNGIKINGQLDNVGNTTIMNHNGSVEIAGTIDNSKGKLGITNKGESINLDSSGKLLNDSEIRLFNYGSGDIILDGEIQNSADVTVINKTGNVEVNGIVNTIDGKLSITNTGKSLSVAPDAIVNSNTLRFVNTGEDGLTIDGKVVTQKSTAITNKAGKFTVNGMIENVDGNLNLTNTGDMLLIDEDATVVNVNGDVLVQNTGKDGMLVNGIIRNDISFDSEGSPLGSVGTTSVTNTKGDLTFGEESQLITSGKAVVLNDGNKISTNGVMIAKELKVINNSEAGMSLGGFVVADDSLAVTNRGGDLNIDAKLSTLNDDAGVNLTNTGAALNFDKNASLTNEGQVLIQNTGAGGINLDGIMKTQAKISVINKSGDLNIDGTIDNSSETVTISNYGAGLNIKENAKVTNDKLIRFVNKGSEKTTVEGEIYSSDDLIHFIEK